MSFGLAKRLDSFKIFFQFRASQTLPPKSPTRKRVTSRTGEPAMLLQDETNNKAIIDHPDFGGKHISSSSSNNNNNNDNRGQEGRVSVCVCERERE
jgi:hypothetical protein